jgi:hypothetical protein
MRDILLGTEERELAEAARRDRIRGIGYKADEAETYREFWGENLLGKALMSVRGREKGVGGCGLGVGWCNGRGGRGRWWWEQGGNEQGESEVGGEGKE